MSPEFRHAVGAPFVETASSPEEGRPIDHSRFRFTNTGRRKLRGKKKTAPAGLHKRHNKRISW